MCARHSPGVWTGVLMAHGAVLDVGAIHGGQRTGVSRGRILPFRPEQVHLCDPSVTVGLA